jgi:hypothetical protein
MADCESIRTRIEESPALAELSGELRAHAETCAACGESLRARASLDGLLRGLQRVEAPADFEFRLRARVNARKGGRGRTFFALLVTAPGYATVAAAILFTVISATIYLRRQHTRAPAVAPKSVAESANHGIKAQPQDTSATVSPPIVSNARMSEVASATGPSRANGERRRSVAQKAREAARADAGARRLASNSFSDYSAPVISRIPVSASAEPLRVVLRDESGAARVVSMRSVSFGSQQLLAREGAARPASVKNVEGVW